MAVVYGIRAPSRSSDVFHPSCAILDGVGGETEPLSRGLFLLVFGGLDIDFDALHIIVRGVALFDDCVDGRSAAAKDGG